MYVVFGRQVEHWYHTVRATTKCLQMPAAAFTNRVPMPSVVYGILLHSPSLNAPSAYFNSKSKVAIENIKGILRVRCNMANVA